MKKKVTKKGNSQYSKADAFGGSKYEVSHIVGKGAYGVVWSASNSTNSPSPSYEDSLV